jgi:type IV pilus assembly protein PilY1
MPIRHFLTRRLPHATLGMLLTVTGGLSAPVPVPASLSVMAAVAVSSALFSEPASAATTTVAGTVELSPGPPNLTQSVPPNIVLTFDDSGSMRSSRVNDQPPWTTDSSGSFLYSGMDWGNGSNQTSTTSSGGGPWRCAGVIDPTATSGIGTHVMNGVYYNPNIIYYPPAYANGTNFQDADATLKKVWVDGLAVKRPLNPVAPDATASYNGNADLDQPTSGSLTDLTGTIPSPLVKTSYVTFGTTCAVNADAGSCQTYPSGTRNGNYVYYYINSDGNSGSGTAKVYYGASLQTNSSNSSGYTRVTGDSTAATQNYATWTVTVDNRWQCGSGAAASGGGGDLWNARSPMDGQSHTLSDGKAVTYPSSGPYYYRFKQNVTIAVDPLSGNPTNTGLSTDGLHTLYNANNWEAVPVTNTTVTINGQSVNQWQNFANWYAYYRTRNQMARSAISRVFGTGTLATSITDGGFGNTIRMAWQNLDDGTYKLPSTAIISSLIDTSACTTTASAAASPSTIQQSGAITTPPDCYRSAFFNWIYQVPANGGTPTRSAVDRAGTFFTRGNGNTATGTHAGNLLDPYWQPATTTTKNGTTTTTTPAAELYCRQNYHMLVTDGLWNGGADGPLRTTLTTAPSGGTIKLPDGTVVQDTATAGVTSIYAPVVDGGDANTTNGTSISYASLSDLAFHYWATNLRSDLYKPLSQQFVNPYMPDQTVGVVSSTTTTASSVAATKVNNEIYFNPLNDPATWPHMSQYLVGLGVSGQLNYSTDTDCSVSSSSDACFLRKGTKNSSGAIGWPTPNGSGGGIPANVDDTWHAALAGRGQFFSAGNPTDLVSQLSKILSNIAARNVPAATSAISAAVLTTGTLGFSTGYSSADWSGLLTAVFVKLDGTAGLQAWDAGALLNAMDPTKRVILSATLSGTGAFAGGVEFKTYANLDSAGQALLMKPASTDATLDTGQTRVDWLRGVKTSETNGAMRVRTNLLGAIIRSQAVYVAYPANGYRNNWPKLSDGTVAPETTATTTPTANTANVSYEQFSSDQSARKPVLYVAANDGMLHAFDASQKADGSNTATSGNELWAYVPRSAYTNLGNLTLKKGFSFAPTVDATPVTRDVFFDTALTTPATTSAGWHTILVAGLGQGGRGIYALDITDPDPTHATTGMNAANVGSKVLWEFNAGMPATTAGDPSHLGYTYGQPNVGRLANGKWVVLVPGGYFPDCSQADQPTNCTSNNTSPSSGSPAVGYSSLFVLNAQTGALISELKTPTTITGVSSYGLSSPVLGDYNNDQIDDVAFAGDLAGNLWRYDLTDPNPTHWTVTLVYQPTTAGAQPITSMPRLFPDPVTNRFIVVFGTGKYLGSLDNTTTGSTQAVYGIRDTGTQVSGTTNLVQQTLNEVAGTGANTGNTIIGITGNAVPASKGGWYFNLVAGGERVVVTPGALFDTNRAVITTLIPNNSNGCSSNNSGSLLIVDAGTGGAGDGLSVGPSSWAGTGTDTNTYKAVGGLVDNPPTGGSVPVATSIGGGKLLFPGINLTGGGSLTGSDAIWRRRSWRELNNDQ